ncbi:leukocyte immunoglobulin-like receptor subfamily B member 4 [Diceros bicornis minor]|uniref:leukocyte immunoglobulin-like receptor subfamily B member 4 n=1 Tax=Diceros bicornis minor TaxID=77932 RepID=UPI0026F232C5|nr:leukocyte immunoglobulin-like receptor subfamily B member 4 [Diceros bicornis minor]
MSLVLPTLLCLGLYPGHCTQSQNRNLPRPDITAVPESMVLSKDPVSIQCQGPAEATAYVISKVGSPERSHTEKQLLSKTTNTLHIAQMTPDGTGLYHCSYQSGDSWSQFSDTLQLVMTGAYDKPSLSSMTGTRVASGENVKLQCFSRFKFDAFILIEEDEVHAIQNQSSTPQDGGHQAIFLLNHVSSTLAGTYRCYGALHNYPYVWSHASDPLQLQVRAPFAEAPDPMNSTYFLAPFAEAPEGPDPTTSRPSTAPPSNENSLEKHQNVLIGVPVAIALLLLVLLLLFIIHRRKAKSNAARSDRQLEAAGPMDGQASEARDPQDVTYSQVTSSVPTQGTAATPSLLPRQTQTSEYATLALR